MRTKAGWTVVIAVAAAGVVGLPARLVAGEHATSPIEVEHTPAIGYPVVRTDPVLPLSDGTGRRRQVYAAAMVGPYIAAGGDFVNVEDATGQLLDRRYFVAWDAASGEAICPALTFDGEVLAIVEGPSPTSAYVAGRFERIGTTTGGVVRSRIALVDLATCALEERFDAGAVDDRIDHLVVRAGRLFVGGSFTRIGGLRRDVVVELDPVTGAVRPELDPSFSGGLDGPVRALAISPDGRRLIVAGKFGTVEANGISLTTESAIFDITDPQAPRLTDHEWSSPHDLIFQTDASVSPDGRWIALVYRGTRFPGRNVFLIAAAEGAQRELWSHDTGNSVFGVGLSDHSVYISGHFCRIAVGPGPTDPMAPAMGITDCAQHPGGAWRSHLAALAIGDGTPLPWNPGHDSQTGGRAIVVTPGGVFTAFDGMHSAGLRTGALALFRSDDAAHPPPPPPPTGPPPPPPPTGPPAPLDGLFDGAPVGLDLKPAVRAA